MVNGMDTFRVALLNLNRVTIFLLFPCTDACMKSTAKHLSVGPSGLLSFIENPANPDVNMKHGTVLYLTSNSTLYTCCTKVATYSAKSRQPEPAECSCYYSYYRFSHR